MPRKPARATAEEATRILDGLAQIAANEQLVRGVYISDDADPELAAAGAICKGHRACLIGSTWLAAGIEPEDNYDHYYEEHITSLPSVGGGRSEFVADKPGLALALRALDEAARRYVKRHPAKDFQDGFLADWENYQHENALEDAEIVGYGFPAEALFEGGFRQHDAELQEQVRKLARAAKRLITTDAVR